MNFPIPKILFLIWLMTVIQGQNVNPNPSRKYRDVKIVNGFEADMKEFYYQGSLRINDQHFCGATIISDLYMLTAGHCTKPHLTHPQKLTVQVGTTFVGSNEGQIVQVNKIIIHGLFNATTLDYDVALLELTEELSFSAIQRPIRVTNMPRWQLEAVGEVSGWGYTTEGGAASKTLKAVKVPLISNSECRAYYPRALTPRMICAGYATGEMDACQGDSGGPLVYNKELIGIVSWGRGCARPRRPGVYTNIYVLRDFVTKYAGIL